MKTKFLQFALVALTALTFTSCSNDDNNNKVQEPNTITIDGKTEIINTRLSLNELYESNSNYGLSLDTHPEKPKDGDTFGVYEFNVVYSRFGEKVTIYNNSFEKGYLRIYLYKIHMDGENISYELIKAYPGFHNEGEPLAGTNNWVQITKNSELKNVYTVEFEMNLEGKIIKGNYTEVFNVYSN